jgi:hypothetical protein
MFGMNEYKGLSIIGFDEIAEIKSFNFLIDFVASSLVISLPKCL